MLRFATESGAVYEIDYSNARVRRTGPFSPGIDYDRVPDDSWERVIALTDIAVGKSVGISLTGSLFRWTTPVTEILEVEAPDGDDAAHDGLAE